MADDCDCDLVDNSSCVGLCSTCTAVAGGVTAGDTGGDGVAFVPPPHQLEYHEEEDEDEEDEEGLCTADFSGEVEGKDEGDNPASRSRS